MFWFGAWVLSIFLAAAVLGAKNHAGTGFILGLFLGPLGFLIALIMAATMADPNQKPAQVELIVSKDGTVVHGSSAGARAERDCPHCAERILAAAKVCKHCGRDVDPIVPVPAPQASSAHCPNCDQRGLKPDAAKCDKCGAQFVGTGTWKPVPDFD